MDDMDYCESTDYGIYKKEKYFVSLFTNVVDGIISARIDDAAEKIEQKYYPRLSAREFVNAYGITDLKEAIDKHFIDCQGIDLTQIEKKEIRGYLFGDIVKDFRVWSSAFDEFSIATYELLNYDDILYAKCHRYEVAADGSVKNIENFNLHFDESDYGIDMVGKFANEESAFKNAVHNKQMMNAEFIEKYEKTIEDYADVERMVYKDAINEIRNYKRNHSQYDTLKKEGELFRADMKGLELCSKEPNKWH